MLSPLEKESIEIFSQKVYKYIRLQGTEEIKFGSTRQVVRGILGNDFKEFIRNEFAENSSDFYSEKNVFVEYDASNVCDALEFSRGAKVEYLDKRLFEFSYSGLVDFFIGISTNFDQDDFGATFYDLGFGASKNSETDEIETVILFSSSYWDE